MHKQASAKNYKSSLVITVDSAILIERLHSLYRNRKKLVVSLFTKYKQTIRSVQYCAKSGLLSFLRVLIHLLHSTYLPNIIEQKIRR